MDKMIIAAFPASAIKICIQSGETGQVVAQNMFWMPDFEANFQEGLDSFAVNEIYVLGPKDYIPKIIDIVKNITDIPVIKEEM